MTGPQMALVAMVVLPAVVGAVLAMAPRANRSAASIALVTAGLSTILAVITALTRPAASYPFLAGADFALNVDALASLIAPMIAAVTFLVLVFAAGTIRESRSRFFGLMLIFSASALVTATAASLPALLFAWELMGATSYALIGFWWRDGDRVSAGLTAFITTRSADLGLYVAAGAALAGGVGMGLADLSSVATPWRHVIAAGILVAALGKAAQLPFSFWLSGAMKGPSPVSALLHSAAMVAMGGYLLLRIQPLLASTGWAGPVAAWVGVATAVLMGFVALGQRNFKQLLAASTVAQLGFVVLAAGVGAVSGGAAHLVAHASVKALLFLVAGAWLRALGTEELTNLRGAARRWRIVGVAATVGALALAGIAPLSLWATKDSVLTAALETSPLLYAAGLVAGAVSAAYAGKILWIMWSRGTHRHARDHGTGTVTGLEQAPLVVLALGAATLGALALPPLSSVLAAALGGGGVVSVVELAVSAGIAVVVVVLMVWLRAPHPRWALGWFGLEAAAHVVIVRPSLALARALAFFDDHVLDRSVTVLAGGVGRLARTAAWADNHGIDRGVSVIADRVGRLGQLARIPQTGAIHHYFLQTIAVLVAGAVIWSLSTMMG
ncbi:NADH-quinone oxidoreductase subunit L [Brevibacterium picturae]|uniref:NADH:quinone oxidoreductase/Mrp antiporter transmembrane domain-containing protein n=1 Tax=Brevibacterium picturae TaxID=260553 RepID=A0ABN2BRX8_9MICO